MDLRGASAEALVALTALLDDEIGTNRSAAALGDELFTVSQLFRGEPGLRRFATDASLPPEAKQGMVQQVFKDRLTEPTLGLLDAAVAKRWTFSRDLPDVLERLSEIAVVRSAGAKAGQVTDERDTQRCLTKGFAKFGHDLGRSVREAVEDAQHAGADVVAPAAPSRWLVPGEPEEVVALFAREVQSLGDGGEHLHRWLRSTFAFEP